MQNQPSHFQGNKAYMAFISTYLSHYMMFSQLQEKVILFYFIFFLCAPPEKVILKVNIFHSLFSALNAKIYLIIGNALDVTMVFSGRFANVKESRSKVAKG